MKSSPLKAAELIRRFQNHECTPEEVRLLEEWVAQLDVPDPTADGLSPDQLDILKNRMYQQLMQTSAVAMYRRRTLKRRYMAAAGWLVLIVSSILLWYTFHRSGALPEPVLLTTILNDQNGIKKITLPDGTIVCLNRNSRLEFDAAHYNQQQRFVKLSGEGYFEVSKDPVRPFIVETGSLLTQVLGTAFNIEAYLNESEIRVALVHGKILLKDTITAQSTLLAPDQSLYYSKEKRNWKIRAVQAGNVMLWTKGYLAFNEVPLQEAVERIAARYHIHIEYKPAQLRNKRITASFEGNNWKAALDNMLFVHGLHANMVNGKLVIE